MAKMARACLHSNLPFDSGLSLTLKFRHTTAPNQHVGKNVDRILTQERGSVGSPSLHICTAYLAAHASLSAFRLVRLHQWNESACRN